MKKFIISCAALLVTGFANASIIYSGPAANNVDTDPATTVALSVLEHGLIQDLNVAVNITGDHMEDFVVSIAHNGIEAQLNPFLTDHRDLFDVVFDDESLNVIPDGGDLVGDYQSFNLLSIFDGVDVFGTWTLSILDSFIPNEGNQLVSWSIEVETGTIPEPATLALIGLGLAGIGFLRRKQQV